MLGEHFGGGRSAIRIIYIMELFGEGACGGGKNKAIKA
jgi:hypothetical protein